MQELTGYHKQLVELSSALVDHGWGECLIRVDSSFSKDNKVKVVIECGKHHVFFIKKSIKINHNDIF